METPAQATAVASQMGRRLHSHSSYQRPCVELPPTQEESRAASKCDLTAQRCREVPARAAVLLLASCRGCCPRLTARTAPLPRDHTDPALHGILEPRGLDSLGAESEHALCKESIAKNKLAVDLVNR